MLPTLFCEAVADDHGADEAVYAQDLSHNGGEAGVLGSVGFYRRNLWSCKGQTDVFCINRSGRRTPDAKIAPAHTQFSAANVSSGGNGGRPCRCSLTASRQLPKLR
jgi:hypothetical protein